MAYAVCDKALELDPKLAEAHLARGYAFGIGRRYEEANAAFEEALRLEPKLVDAHHFYGRSLLQQGKFAEAAERFREAYRLRPEGYQDLSFLAQALETIATPEEVREAREAATLAVERHLEFHPDDARALNIGAVHAAQAGRLEKGLEWMRRSLATSPEDSNLLYNAACFFAIQGQIDEALECLGKAVDNGWQAKDWLAHDPDLDALRQDPRFQAIVDRM